MQKLSKIVGSDKVAGYVFIAPFIIGLITFTVIPFFQLALSRVYGLRCAYASPLDWPSKLSKDVL